MTAEKTEKCARQPFNTVLQNLEPYDLDRLTSGCPDTTGIVQLSEGRFAGRVLDLKFPGIAFCLEWCNQTIEKEVHLEDDKLTFCTFVDTPAPDLSFNGVNKKNDWVLLQTRGCEDVLIFPAESTLLTVKIRKSAVREFPDFLPEITDWLQGARAHGEFLKTKVFAYRLREVGRVALEASQLPGNLKRRQAFGDNLLVSLVTGLIFEWLSKQTFSTYQKPRALELFQAARPALLEHEGDAEPLNSCQLERLGSRRSIEKAFGKLLNMGPAKYSRIVRLNNSRRKLRDKNYADASIGDIAAQEGFWDWSRFTSYYRKQFDELPSETRSRCPFTGAASDPRAA
ncbi:MAG: helix-turn-helix domain-containing protein [Roseibium sp.]|uniref:AraC family transcriptional regulator n=1 Tax=Roseibium sp. TaxID=1936156 RepID=UPI003D9C51A5